MAARAGSVTGKQRPGQWLARITAPAQMTHRQWLERRIGNRRRLLKRLVAVGQALRDGREPRLDGIVFDWDFEDEQGRVVHDDVELSCEQFLSLIEDEVANVRDEISELRDRLRGVRLRQRQDSVALATCDLPRDRASARPRERRPGRRRRAVARAGPDDPDLADLPDRRGAPV